MRRKSGGRKIGEAFVLCGSSLFAALQGLKSAPPLSSTMDEENRVLLAAAELGRADIIGKAIESLSAGILKFVQHPWNACGESSCPFPPSCTSYVLIRALSASWNPDNRKRISLERFIV